MAKYKQYLLRLNPQNPEDAALIEYMEAARAEWGGVQRVIKDALTHYHLRRQGNTVSQPASPPTSLLEDLARAVPNLAPAAAEAMADSPPLRPIRALYAALEAFSPQSLTDIDALLLQLTAARIHNLLENAASQRQSIRQILERTGDKA